MRCTTRPSTRSSCSIGSSGKPAAAADGVSWDARGWIGTRPGPVLVAHGGRRAAAGVSRGDVHVLYGRAISPLVGRRRRRPAGRPPGPAQTWAAVGIQGLAPYRIRRRGDRLHRRRRAGPSCGSRPNTNCCSRTGWCCSRWSRSSSSARTIRHAASAPGCPRSTRGLRLRYEIRRELAPYVGVTWHHTLLRHRRSRRGRRRAIGRRPCRRRPALLALAHRPRRTIVTRPWCS